MNKKAEKFIRKFFRTYTEFFTLDQMEKICAYVGIKAERKEIQEFLESNPFVFALENGMFITRAGAFTNEVFSIKPTAAEFDQGLFIPGDRCMPFADGDRLSFTYSFYLNGHQLPQKTGWFDSDLAIDMFSLFGEEYASQYIANDPAAKDLDIEGRDFELPNNVSLTGIDLEPLVKLGFKKGDRLLCCVSNWDQCKINVMIQSEKGEGFDRGVAGEKRLKWYEKLEKYLLESFDRRGPMGTIEEQISIVFFEHRQDLCVPNCGSIEEYLNRYAKNVGMEFFGVETRLWKKGDIVPAVGEWNRRSLEGQNVEIDQFGVLENVLYTFPDFIMEEFLHNVLFSRVKDTSNLISLIIPEEMELDEGIKTELESVVNSIFSSVSKEYNWFRDQTIGPVRTKALELYKKVAVLVFNIDIRSKDLGDFPQQELVILSQIFSHLVSMLQTLSDYRKSGRDLTDSESDNFLLSVEGMGWNFEEVKIVLENALKVQEMNRFKIIK